MSLLKKRGSDEKKSVDSPTSSPSRFFRKSTSFDTPGVENDRPQSQQSGYSQGGNRKKIIPSFISNLFGNGSKVPVPATEAKQEESCAVAVIVPVPAPIPEKVMKSGRVGGGSHESINSVQSSSSFSFVNPTKMGGKKVKGKRIPVDDPNYGSTTNNGKTNEVKKIGTLDRIGIKIGLKKKYNLQSCESLQYIDACDEPLPIVAGNKSAAKSSSGSSQKQTAASQGQPSSSETKTNEMEASGVVGQKELPEKPNAVVNAEFSANCLARSKHVVQSKRNSKEFKDAPLNQLQRQESSESQGKPAGKRKEFFESSAQTASPIKEVINANVIVKKDEMSKPEVKAPKPEIKAKPDINSSELALKASKPQVKAVEPVAIISGPATKVEKPEVKESKTETKGLKSDVNASKPAITALNPEVKASEPEQNISQLALKETKPEVKASESKQNIESTITTSKPEIKTSETKSEVKVSEPGMKDVKPVASVQTEQQTENNERKAIITISTAKATESLVSEPPKPSTSVDDAKPCSSRSLMENPKPSTSSASADTNNPFFSPGSSNTWSNSNRRKRRAPQPPSDPTHKFASGTSSTSNTEMVTETPNDVPSSSSKAAILTKFKRIDESPPPPSSRTIETNPFEIRPRKKEKSLEPMPVTRPSASYVPPLSNSNTLFSTRHQRYQQHQRSCSEGFSTNTKGRIHKPGKKKAPPPPNPFGDPDDDGESSVNAETNSETIPPPSSGTSKTSDASERQKPSSTCTSTETSSSLATLPPVMPNPIKRSPKPQKQSLATSTKSIPVRLEQQPVPATTPVSNNSCSTTVSSNTSTSTRGPTITSTPRPPSPPSSSPPHSANSTNRSTTFTFNDATITSTTSEPDPVTQPLDDLLEEIRQNMINDEHERQQLGMLQQNNDSQLSPTTSETPSTSQSVTAPTDVTPALSLNTSTGSNTSPNQITETDIQSAQRALAALSASIQTPAPSSSQRESVTDPSLKAKLVELKKEADKSSLNVPKTKSRPASVASSIYESPLALLFGKSLNSTNAGNGSTEITSTDSPAESTPKPASKPWYKRGGPSALSNPFSSKSKHTTPIKPFSALCKFSELDNEAARIVEENKRKSAEHRFSESDQDELDELFSSTIAAGSVDINTSGNGERSPGESSRRNASASHTKVLTTAQVHPVIAEEGDSSVNPPQPSSSPNNRGSASPPAFQSVHAASKHRQIKPLLNSSPITNVRSEKLAIVQPQTNVMTTSSTFASTTPSSTTTTSSSASSPRLSSTTFTGFTSRLLNSTPNENIRSMYTEGEWACPRCTLKNPGWRILCEICFHRKDTAPCGSYISSILQRVNSEANTNRAASVSSSPTQVTSTPPSTTALTSTVSSTNEKIILSQSKPNAVISSSSPITSTSVITAKTSTSTTVTSSSQNQCIPSVVEQFKPTTSIGQSTKASDVKSDNKKADIPRKPSPPPCENFMSQLPIKEVKEKEGIKLHEDPELEELDISRLREARLAYFQRRESSETSTPAATPPPTEPRKALVKQNNFNTDEDKEDQPESNEHHSSQSNKNTTQVTSLLSTNSDTEAHQTFSDNEDDFLDNMLQLDNHEVANISSLPCPPSDSRREDTASPTQLQNRYRPKLEAIREGNSQDYTYCYSPSEIAKIYENWQTRQEQNNTSFISNKSSSIPSGTYLLEHHPLLLSNVQRMQFSNNCNAPVRAHHAPVFPPMLDRQPYANNRSADSPEENYVNTTTPRLLTDTTQFMRANSNSPSPLCLSPLQFASHQHCGSAGASVINSNSNNQQNCLSGNNNQEGIMSLNPGNSRAYEEYRRMGAIPKGFLFKQDDWSSESSGDTDSSRGMWLRGGGYQDSMPGTSSRMGTLEFTQPFDFSGLPDQNIAVGKLMRRLETAITNGDHRLAATLAHDLALMKVNCVVSKINQPFSIRVYVEDRFMQQGPFLVQVSAMMTVSDLKAKIESDWGIPSGFQKWILGKKMAEDDNHLLTSYEMSSDSMAFLFLVSPDDNKNLRSEIPVESKLINQGKSPSAVSTLSVSPSIVACASLNRNDNRRSVSPRNIPSIPTGHTYDVIQEDTMHLYNNLDNEIKPKVSPTKSKSGERKSSAKTSTSSKETKELTPPPPLPPKSPIPGTSKSNAQHLEQQKRKLSEEKVANTGGRSSSSVVSNEKQRNVVKGKGESQQQPKLSVMNGENPSATSIITASLQQKLAEFKVIAEQTFKSGISVLPRSSSKERSPAPGPSTSKVAVGNVKMPHKRNDASQRKSRSIDVTKERLVTSAPGSIEKLSESNDRGRERTPNKKPEKENRFNGILLATPDTDNIKPPERLDKLKRMASPGRTLDDDIKPSQKIDQVCKKPPIPPQLLTSSTDSRATSPPTSTDQNVDDSKKLTESPSSEAPAPHPKPRILRKQQSAPEKVQAIPQTVQDYESQIAPTPAPRTSNIAKPDPTSEKTDDSSNSGTEASTSSKAEEKVDDFSQTTLPFPAPKQAKSSETGHQIGTVQPTTVITNFVLTPQINSPANISLLRPSAFVSQMKPEVNQAYANTQPPTVLLPILSANFTTATTLPSFGESNIKPGSSVAIAHVHPISKPPTPTAYVSPSPSSPRAQNPGGGDPIKKDDSAQNYLSMLELMEKQDLISTTEDAECPVCFTFIPKGEGVVLRDCLHIFCKECLVGCVVHADESSVKCPYRDTDYACNYTLQEREIKALVPSEIFEKYLARSVKLAENQSLNSYHCKTPDCTGWCLFEADVNTFMCPVCKKRNCINCQAIHEGINCQEFQRQLAIAAETDEDVKQSRLMLEKMIQRGEALDCPACHVVLLKKWGCDWVRCSYCKTEICWVTKGFRWGKGGKGDTSGGCRCGINGVKCHPKCTYCH